MQFRISKRIIGILTVIVFLCLSLSSIAQIYPDPFLDDDQRINALLFLPDPPSPDSGIFENDRYYYEWGKEQRKDSVVAQRAIYNYLHSDPWDFCSYYSDAVGFEISDKNTPEISTLIQRCTEDAYMVNRAAKNHYQRQRPFAFFGESSLYPEDDESKKNTFSYPSGHASNSYGAALALCMVATDRVEAILKAANEYALDRVICGHHYKSDIDAAFMLAQATIFRVQMSEEYQEQLAKARQEYAEIRKKN